MRGPKPIAFRLVVGVAAAVETDVVPTFLRQAPDAARSGRAASERRGAEPERRRGVSRKELVEPWARQVRLPERREQDRDEHLEQVAIVERLLNMFRRPALEGVDSVQCCE